VKIIFTAENEQRRAIFVQMARTWLALAQKTETNGDRDDGPEEQTN
jgi:hypothetical protein